MKVMLDLLHGKNLPLLDKITIISFFIIVMRMMMMTVADLLHGNDGSW